MHLCANNPGVVAYVFAYDRQNFMIVPARSFGPAWRCAVRSPARVCKPLRATSTFASARKPTSLTRQHGLKTQGREPHRFALCNLAFPRDHHHLSMSTTTTQPSYTSQYRLPTNVKPSHYDLTIQTDLDKLTFNGYVKIRSEPFLRLHLLKL